MRIITAAAGGGSDFATRLIAGPLGAALGQQVIVENRGLLAADVAAKAPPDGYTLLLVGQTLWMLPFMREKVASNVADFSAGDDRDRSFEHSGRASDCAGEIGAGFDRSRACATG